MLEKCTKSFLKILLTPLFKLDEMIDPGFNPYDRRGNGSKVVFRLKKSNKSTIKSNINQT